MKHPLAKICVISALCIFSTALWAQLQPRSISSLDNTLGQNRPLPLDQAFPYFVSETGEESYEITWTPAPGHYLYRHAFGFSLQESATAAEQALAFTLPDGLKKSDQFFGDIEAYYNTVSASITVNAEALPQGSLIIEYQGCADWGFCYPPQRATFKLTP